MLDISGESYLFEIVFYERIRAADSYRNRLLFGLLSVMLRAGDESERFFHDIVGITHNMNYLSPELSRFFAIINRGISENKDKVFLPNPSRQTISHIMFSVRRT